MLLHPHIVFIFTISYIHTNYCLLCSIICYAIFRGSIVIEITIFAIYYILRGSVGYHIYLYPILQYILYMRGEIRQHRQSFHFVSHRGNNISHWKFLLKRNLSFSFSLFLLWLTCIIFPTYDISKVVNSLNTLQLS